MNTDSEWEKWGQKDPYYGVLTGEQYRSGNFNAESKREFFQLGQEHFNSILQGCLRIEPNLRPKRALDFGCGVGRLLIPLARISKEAVGVDVSTSMLKLAATHSEEQGLKNVTLAQSDDSLSRVQGKFDFIMTFIVMQHIPVKRGKVIFSRFLDLLEPGGIAAIHMPYARLGASRIYGASWLRPIKSGIRTSLPFLFKEPEMQMNCYPLDYLLNTLQNRGIKDLHIELSSHGACLFAFLYFRKP